ncbi:MAG: hypothetical protein ACJ788_05600 [Ktedonobacteraceae bacterium]
MAAKQRQAYQAYLAACELTDAGKHGSLLRVHTDQEQALYDAWQATLKEDETEQESQVDA